MMVKLQNYASLHFNVQPKNLNNLFLKVLKFWDRRNNFKKLYGSENKTSLIFQIAFQYIFLP